MTISLLSSWFIFRCYLLVVLYGSPNVWIHWGALGEFVRREDTKNGIFVVISKVIFVIHFFTKGKGQGDVNLCICLPAWWSQRRSIEKSEGCLLWLVCMLTKVSSRKGGIGDDVSNCGL